VRGGAVSWPREISGGARMQAGGAKKKKKKKKKKIYINK
jgi:hypothetical protein